MRSTVISGFSRHSFFFLVSVGALFCLSLRGRRLGSLMEFTMHFPVTKSHRPSAIKPLLLVSVLASCFAASAIAQEAAGTEEKTLQPVVVTASRVEQLQKDAIPDTTVITSGMIRNKKLADLPTLLRSEAGIELSRNGGAGSATSVFMRGTESRHVLILLDGVPLQDATAIGTVDSLAHIQTDQIDHIEVVRGNVSSIYGSGAVGGVIQIFTKQGTGKPSAHVFAEYGSHDTVKLGAGTSGKTEGGTSFALSATRYKTNGFSAMDPAKNTAANPDDDHDKNVSVSAAVSQRLNADHELGARVYWYDAKFDFDNTYPNAEEISKGKSKQLVASAFSKNRLTKDWLSTVTVSHNELRRNADQITGFGLSANSYKSEINLLQWSNQLALSSDWTLTAGAEGGHENAKTDAYGSKSNWGRDKYSVYTGILGKVGAHNLQANLRYDHVEKSGSDVTGYLGYAYDVTAEWKLLANVSTSFLAPSMAQLHDMANGGNPDLEAEKSKAAELGVQYAKGDTLVRATAFEWRTQDLINWVADYPGAWTGTNYNVGKAKNHGVDLTASTKLVGLDFRANLTLQDPKNRETGEALLKRAKSFASLDVSKTYGSWYLGGNIQYTGHRTDYGDIRLPSYTLFNLDARYNLNKNVSLYARIENIFDKDYETTYGYEQPGRGAYVGVNFKM